MHLTIVVMIREMYNVSNVNEQAYVFVFIIHSLPIQQIFKTKFLFNSLDINVGIAIIKHNR